LANTGVNKTAAPKLMTLLLQMIALLILPVFSIAQAKADSNQYVVLCKDSTRNPYQEDKAYTATTLSATELLLLDSLLQSCVTKYNAEETQHYKNDRKRYPKVSLNLDDYFIPLAKYKRQYIPVINAKGEKEVWVNCFRSEGNEHSYWRKSVVFVFDGGNYYFNTTINLATKMYFPLRPNGVG
jgi:hypothetical protein